MCTAAGVSFGPWCRVAHVGLLGGLVPLGSCDGASGGMPSCGVWAQLSGVSRAGAAAIAQLRRVDSGGPGGGLVDERSRVEVLMALSPCRGLAECTLLCLRRYLGCSSARRCLLCTCSTVTSQAAIFL